MNDKHVGSDFDDLLREDGLLEEAKGVAAKRILAYQISEAMKEQELSESAMARRMGTRRSSLDRLLDPEVPSVTLLTLEKAARALGKRVRFELVDAVAGEGQQRGSNAADSMVRSRPKPHRIYRSLEPAVEELKRQAQEYLKRQGVPLAPSPAADSEKLQTASSESQDQVSPPRESELTPYMEALKAPFLDWHQEVLQSRLPVEWEGHGIELPPEGRHRLELLDALWYAALVRSLVDGAQMATMGPLTLVHFELIGCALGQALEFIASFDVEQLGIGARTQWTNRENAQRPYRRAAVDLIRRIMECEGVEKMEEILKWLGTSYYSSAEVDGRCFKFVKRQKSIRISEVTEDGEREVHRLKYPSSTVYDWWRDARK